MQFEAFYTVKSKNINTDEVKTLHTQSNLITDYGLNYFGNGSRTKTSNDTWTLNNCAIWLQDFDEPTVQLEELIVPYKSGAPALDLRTKFLHNVGNNGSSSEYSVKGFDDGLECYIEQTRTYTFPHKYIVGDMYGIYLGCFNSFGDYTYYPKNDPRVYPWEYQSNSTSNTYTKDHVFSIFSAIKFKDPVTGLNKSIPVAEIEQIFIEYTLRRYLPKYTKPKVYHMTSSMNTEHTVTVQPRWQTDTYYAPVNDRYNYRSPFDKFDTDDEHVDIRSTNQVHYEDGTTANFYDSTSHFSRSILPYKNNSYKQGSRFYYDLNAANKKIKHIMVGCNMGTMKVTFDPPIEKTIERKFNLALEWNWARGDVLEISRDPLAISNPNFDIDLSDWNLEEDSNLTRNEIGGISSIYLSNNKINTFDQTIDISEHILTNRRFSVIWDSAKKGSYVEALILDYKDENDLTIHTQTVPSSAIFSEDASYFKRSYSHFNIDEEAITAQKVNLKFKLKTGNSSDNYIALNNIQMYITNMTPIEV